jgi:hypothetical protein
MIPTHPEGTSVKNISKAAFAGAVILALSGAGVAASLAANGDPGTPAPAITAAPAKDRDGGTGKGMAIAGLHGRAIHGELVVDRDGKLVTVAVQTGTVKASDAGSVTVMSKDGYTATYKITGATTTSPAGNALAAGTAIRIQAASDGDALVAERIAAVKDRQSPARESADGGKRKTPPGSRL